MGVVSATYNMLPGGLAYRNGETNVLSAVRLYDEKTFSITIAKTGEDGETSYLPYYYDITYAAMQAVNLTYWFGEGWSVKDDGEGVYFVNADGKEFTTENVSATIKAARFATGNRVTAGPYNLVSFDQSSREIVLEVNENYNGNFEGQKPGIQKLVIVKTSEDTVMDMITTGQIQIYSQIADGSEVNAVIGSSSRPAPSTAPPPSMTAPVTVTSALPATLVRPSSPSSVRRLPICWIVLSLLRPSARAGAA